MLHVVDGFPGDAILDILEGVLQYVCTEMLKGFLFEDKYFNIEQLTKRIGCFHYGHFNRSKPSPIIRETLKSDNSNLKQKAVYHLYSAICSNFTS